MTTVLLQYSRDLLDNSEPPLNPSLTKMIKEANDMDSDSSQSGTSDLITHLKGTMTQKKINKFL